MTATQNDGFTVVASKKRARKQKKVEKKVEKKAPKKKGRGRVLQIQVGKTYTEEKRSRNSGYDKRCRGFETMGDKKALETRLAKTSMCRSVKTGKRCRHKKCRFAHSIKELTIRECAFGEECRFVRFVDGKWVNKSKTGKMCSCSHPGEAKEDYFARCGIECPTKKVVVAPRKLVLKPKVDEVKATPVVRTPVVRTKANPWGKKVPKALAPVPLTRQVADGTKGAPTIIRVPAAMFEKAMEMAMKRGLENFEIVCT
jgi:hypothetical protein